jgi:hypothetical protein
VNSATNLVNLKSNQGLTKKQVPLGTKRIP